MDEIFVLLLLCLAMLFGCYIAGTVPLIVSLSEEKLRLVTILGAGILVGTALSVIIPEGVNTLYSSYIESLEHRLKVLETSGAVKSGGGPSTNAELNALYNPESRETHSVIGVTLVLGFVFMLLIDQIGNAHSRYQSLDAEGGIKQDRNKITATLGLVVHAAADGVALGAAATTSHADIEMIVFVAIMLHKAPAAFGLVTFLMHEGLDRTRIRKHLMVFALAAPVLALITYFGISQSTREALSNYNATGMAMLFSAGTFLYVATVHVLPEVATRSHSHSSNGEPLLPEPKGFKKMELLVLVTGAILPLFISVGHHH